MEPGSLHLVVGMAGAGKTTYAKRLQSSLPGVRLCPDEWILPRLDSRHDRTTADRLRAGVETMLWQLAQPLLVSGIVVIMENGFWRRAERDALREVAQSGGSKVHLYLMETSRDLIIERVIRRNLEQVRGTFHIEPHEIDEWLGWFETPIQAEMDLFDTATVIRSTR